MLDARVQKISYLFLMTVFLVAIEVAKRHHGAVMFSVPKFCRVSRTSSRGRLQGVHLFHSSIDHRKKKKTPEVQRVKWKKRRVSGREEDAPPLMLLFDRYSYVYEKKIHWEMSDELEYTIALPLSLWLIMCCDLINRSMGNRWRALLQGDTTSLSLQA